MKTLYPNPHAAHSRNRNATRKLFLFTLLFVLFNVGCFAAGSPSLDFKSYTLESGTAGSDGAVYRFKKVNAYTDALLKIKSRSGAQVYLENIDLITTGFDKALQPVVGYNNSGGSAPIDWWMEFEISFVQQGTNIPVTVSDFDMSAIDIDGNGNRISEYVSFYGLSSYVLEEESVLKTADIMQNINGVTSVAGKRFDGPTTNFADIDTSGTSVMVSTTYLNTNKFTIRAGAVSTSTSLFGSSERMYSFYFKDFTYQVPQQVILAAKLKSFDATLTSSKVVLNWVSLIEQNMSHYVIERSRNGRDFDEITMIFSNGSATEQASYSFSDNLGASSQGLVYYRLKMVEDNGSTEYSKVKIIKLTGKGAEVTVSAYPNPVTSELRITIPAAWQDKPVSYEMYNVNGQVVKHFQNGRASQTETLQMSDVKPGIYTIRLSTGNDSATQRIIKSN